MTFIHAFNKYCALPYSRHCTGGGQGAELRIRGKDFGPYGAYILTRGQRVNKSEVGSVIYGHKNKSGQVRKVGDKLDGTAIKDLIA